MGPPKSLGRCLEKGAKEGMATLLDLNRASVVVEHPIVMAVVYYVLLAHLERRGGKISKVKNKLLSIHCRNSTPVICCVYVSPGQPL